MIKIPQNSKTERRPDAIGKQTQTDGPSRTPSFGLRITLWLLLLVLQITISSAADYVIVVDVSGSMTGPVSHRDKRVRIAVVQEALRQYLPALPSGARLNLIAFSTGIVSDKEFVLKDENEVAQAMAWVDGLATEARKNGQTHLWTTLRQALQTASRYSQESPEQPVTVRVLTDGEDNERATSLDKVLAEFRPLLDGEHIRGNLVLLGDLELKTKLPILALPDGAFETTTNSAWEDIFPPVVLWSPAQPTAGEQVRMFENTKSIYKDYEWLVDGTVAGKEKVLTWRFAEPRIYKVTLRVRGLQGTKNSTTVLVRTKEREKLSVDFVMSPSAVEPQQEIKFVARCGGQAVKFAWYVNSNLIATNQDFTFRFEADGRYEVKLAAWDAAGTSGNRSHTVDVREKILAVSIKGPTEVIAGRTVQFASEISGPCSSIEWGFGDGTASGEKNPQHTFDGGATEFRDCQVTLRALTPLGKSVEATPHTVRVWAEKKVQPPRAALRVLNQNPKAGDLLQLVDESQGLVDGWEWEVLGEATSRQRSPAIRVTSPGAKTIRLTVSGPGGTAAVTNSIVVNPRYTAVKAKAATSPQSGEAPLKVQMTSEIAGDFTSLRWSFGDGQFSTNSSPIHTFTQASNYTVSLVVSPSDPTQTPLESRFVVSVRKPVPAWVKALPFVGCSALLAGGALLLARHRQKKALRLSIYFWPEESSVCRNVVLTCADEVRELTPETPLRIKRVGRSSNLVVEPVNEAILLSSSGQELTSQNIGQGARVLVHGASNPAKAVAISTVQKPRRPSPASADSEPFAEKAELAPAAHGEFDWGWETTESAKPN